MALDLREHLEFLGPAFPAPFVEFELERALGRAGLLTQAATADALTELSWEAYRRILRELVGQAGAIRVRNHVFLPLVARLGYGRLESGGEVETREGREDGGDLMLTADGAARLRVWSADLDVDLDAPARRGDAYRFSHVRIAQRVLLATGERLGLLTNGRELRLLVSDPARPDSQIVVRIDPGWKRGRAAPDSFRLVLALASPAGVKALPDLVEQARLQQARVTRALRDQARQAVEGFVQAVLDHPENRSSLAARTDTARLARDLWREGLIVVYRLLFILKLEASDDPARSFSFASTSLWRNSFSPSTVLAARTRDRLDRGVETGRFLEQGLRTLFRMFTEGVESTELHVRPLGGSLFGEAATPVLSPLRWGEDAVARLLDRLLWTPPGRGGEPPRRVHYGPLDVEDLGRVYEALLELEPGIATEPMCRLRRQKLEVVVPLAQGERYRTTPAAETADDEEEDEPEEEEAPAGRGKTRVEWIEAIDPGRFYLRVGLGRKATGSYYTPHSFVRFLVQETLGPQVAERSPREDPRPAAILSLRVLDPAMGSGHFLVEACRFLGEKLYEACRLCDERALAAERRAETSKEPAVREAATAEALAFRGRVAALPDPDRELLQYLPSRAPEQLATGLSQRRAEALCRRLVAVHCLYGVDKNPLAVELAKLSLWIEAHAEGLPLTFLDHRLVLGDSLTGPFFEHLLTYPSSQQPMNDLFTRGLRDRFAAALGAALVHVRDLEAGVGRTVAEVEAKAAAKRRLDDALAPFRLVAAAWAGGVMLGEKGCDDQAYAKLVRAVAETGEVPEELRRDERLAKMVQRGLGQDAPALPYDLIFAEVFFGEADLGQRGGFNSVLGNPPWDAIQFKSKEFLASFDVEILNAPTKRERIDIERRLAEDFRCATLFEAYKEAFEEQKRVNDVLFQDQKVEVDGDLAGRQVDAFRVFMERGAQLLGRAGATGLVVPSAFHANEGATGVRRLYLERMTLRCCYSFENRRKLFEIDSRFKFALVVAVTGGKTKEFPCAFFLHSDEWLFGDRTYREPLIYTIEFVRVTGGPYLTLLELRSTADLSVAKQCFAAGRSFRRVCDERGIGFGAECHMTNDAWRFTRADRMVADGEDPRDPELTLRLLEKGLLVLHEGKTFRQYDDRWSDPPRYLVSVDKLGDRPSLIGNARFYRLAHRKIAGPGDENISIWAIHPPGTIHGDSCPVEVRLVRRDADVLGLLALANSSTFDFLLGLRVRANVLGFMRDAQPMPVDLPWGFLAHGALRLTCNHTGFASLWRSQLGGEWRESRPPFLWPVLLSSDERWSVRASIDAVVAGAYGLSRDHYAHILSSLSFRSYPDAPRLCLEPVMNRGR